MRALPALSLPLPRTLLAALLLAGAAFPAAVLLSAPAMAEDGGGDGGGDGGADGGAGGDSSGNCPGGGMDSGCGGCGGYGGISGGAGYDAGGGGDWGWTYDGGAPMTSWTPSLDLTTFTLPVCGMQTAQANGFGHRGDSTFVPGWGACRR